MQFEIEDLNYVPNINHFSVTTVTSSIREAGPAGVTSGSAAQRGVVSMTACIHFLLCSDWSVLLVVTDVLTTPIMVVGLFNVHSDM